jgi:TrmH family RNA methyltransferase
MTVDRVLGPLGPSNPRIRTAAGLRTRRARDETGLTLIDGARESRRALAAGVHVVEAFLCDPLLAGPDARAVLDALDRADIPVRRTTERGFASIAFGDRAEGIVLVARVAPARLADLVLPAAPLLVVVVGVEKPGNLGAILRTADAVGADGVIAASPRTDLFNPNVIRASAGTVFSVPTAAAPSTEVALFLRERGIQIMATHMEADRSYTEAPLSGAIAIVLGAEDRGLGADWSGRGIETIRVPMHGIADSLNVSATAAIVLYEARRQRDHAAAEGS